MSLHISDAETEVLLDVGAEEGGEVAEAGEHRLRHHLHGGRVLGDGCRILRLLPPGRRVFLWLRAPYLAADQGYQRECYRRRQPHLEHGDIFC